MTITEYVAELERLRATHGDIEVFQGCMNTTLEAISPARPPQIKEVAALFKREHNARSISYCELHDPVRYAMRKTGRMIVYVGR